MKTTVTKPKHIKRSWHLIDADGQTLGRLSTRIAKLLMGKDKVYYSPHLDCGDYVVVVNSEKVRVTGNKADLKLYRHHTGFPGGFREKTYAEIKAASPVSIIDHSVKGMLPKNKLRQLRMKRLKIVVGPKHRYTNQLKES
jgi:large subunit ribosomal protein L13